MIPIGEEERFRCPEALFQPSLLGGGFSAAATTAAAAADGGSGGLHYAVHKCIKKCDNKYTKPGMGRNIVLGGGTTCLPGLGDRLQKELEKLIPSNWNVNVIVPPERKHCAWIGASLLTSLGTFQSMWISDKEYQEVGKKIVHTKCF